jgi:hypothetical protein
MAVQSRPKRARYLRNRSASLVARLAGRATPRTGSARRPTEAAAAARQTLDHISELDAVEGVDACRHIGRGVENVERAIVRLLAAARPRPSADAAIASNATASRSSMRPAGLRVAIRVTRGAEVAEVRRARSASGRNGEARGSARAPRLLKVTRAALPLGRTRRSSKSRFGAMSSRRSREARQAEGPEVEPGEQVFAEPPRRNGGSPGRGWCRRSAGSRSPPRLSAPTGRKRPSSTARRTIACSSSAEFADLVEEEHAALSAALSRPATLLRSAPVKAPLARGRTAPTSRRRRFSVAQFTSTNGAAELAPQPSSARRCLRASWRLPGPGRPASAAAARGSSARPPARSRSIIRLKAALRVSMPALEEARRLLGARGGKARRDAVVARQVEVDGIPT